MKKVNPRRRPATQADVVKARSGPKPSSPFKKYIEYREE